MAKFTKKAIMDCFLNMLKRKNIDRVTVQIYVRNVELTGIHFIIISAIYMMCLTVFL